MLRHFGVVPVLVFDGANLPMKDGTDMGRELRRRHCRSEGMRLLREGNSSGAEEQFQKAVEITPAMAAKVIDRLKAMGVEFVVAPYEADAQLAFLAHNGLVDAVITEDSDLLAFGCGKVLFKMDKFGSAQQVDLTLLGATKKPCFVNFTQRMFRHTCMLSGCDYLPSVPGVGLKKAHALVKRFRNVDAVIDHLASTFGLPDNYREQFRRSDLTFLHQRVFDPRTRRIVTLTPLPDELDAAELDFIGPPIDVELAHQIADGLADPNTKLPFQGEQNVPANVHAVDALDEKEKDLVDEDIDQDEEDWSSSSSLPRRAVLSAKPVRAQRASRSANSAVFSSYSLSRYASSSSSTGSQSAPVLPAQRNVILNYFDEPSVDAAKAFAPPRRRRRQREENDSDAENESSSANIVVEEVSPPKRQRVVVRSRFF
jgi:5'-3' exonuclease